MTTIHFVVYRGTDRHDIFGAGIARLGVRGILASQFLSIKVGYGFGASFRKIDFCVRFLAKVASIYGRPVTDLTHRPKPRRSTKLRQLALPKVREFQPVTEDGVKLRLRRDNRNDATKGPVILATGYGVAVPSRSQPTRSIKTFPSIWSRTATTSGSSTIARARIWTPIRSSRLTT